MEWYNFKHIENITFIIESYSKIGRTATILFIERAFIAILLLDIQMAYHETPFMEAQYQQPGIYVRKQSNMKSPVHDSVSSNKAYSFIKCCGCHYAILGVKLNHHIPDIEFPPQPFPCHRFVSNIISVALVAKFEYNNFHKFRCNWKYRWFCSGLVVLITVMPYRWYQWEFNSDGSCQYNEFYLFSNSISSWTIS